MNIVLLLPNTNSQTDVACMVDKEEKRSLSFCGFWKQNKKKFISAVWPQPIANYYGRTVRATVVQKPSVFTFNADHDGLSKTDGWMSELTGIIQKRLNFTTVLVPTNTFGSQKKDKSWSGMVGVLYTDKADISLLDFSPLHIRLDYIEFSTFLSTDYEVILSRAPQKLIDPFLLLKVFSPIMWGLLTAVIISTGVVIGVITVLEEINDKAQVGNIAYHIYQCTVMVMKACVYQSSKYGPKGHASRLLSTFSLLFALIIYSVYDGVVISFLAIPHRTKPIDTMTDLLDSDSIPAVRKDTTSAIYILEKTTDITIELSTVIVQIPGQQLSTWDFFSKLADGYYSYIDTLTSAIGRASRFEKKGQRCLYYVSKTPVKVEPDVYAFRRNFPLRQSFNKIIKKLRSFGIIEKMKKNNYALSCQPLVRENAISPLKIIQVQSAFYVLLIGCVVSFLVFVMEFCLCFPKNLLDF